MRCARGCGHIRATRWLATLAELALAQLASMASRSSVASTSYPCVRQAPGASARGLTVTGSLDISPQPRRRVENSKAATKSAPAGQPGPVRGWAGGRRQTHRHAQPRPRPYCGQPGQTVTSRLPPPRFTPCAFCAWQRSGATHKRTGSAYTGCGAAEFRAPSAGAASALSRAYTTREIRRLSARSAR